MIDWPAGVTGEIADEIDSTNREAERRAAAGATGPLWLAARRQTAGRGRQGRDWDSPTGNLFATYLTVHDAPPSAAALTGFAAALAVADTLGHFAPSAEIQTKWPNDVLLNGAKTSGILLESLPGRPARLAIGIGLNLASHPPQHVTRWRATSLLAETGRTPDFEAALGTLAQRLDHWLARLRDEGFAAIREPWLARAAQLGGAIEVRLPNETLAGIFADLDADGALVLEGGPRQRRRIAAGDVFFPGGNLMLLAIDVGNTNTVFALHDGKAFVAEWRCNTESARTADQYFVWLSQLMVHKKLDPGVISDVVISNTAPATLFNLRVLCDRYFGTRPLVVGKPECKLPVDVRVDPGTNVGADRLVNTVAAFDRYGGDLIVVDFGTATTLDVVAADGAYIGGAIAPGVNLSLDALHQAAAHLPRIDVTMPPQVLGRNTVHCMQTGIFWGYIGLIEGIAKRIADERGTKMRVIATGGLSPLFARASDMIEAFDPDLTMHGLVLIHAHNTGA